MKLQNRLNYKIFGLGFMCENSIIKDKNDKTSQKIS